MSSWIGTLLQTRVYLDGGLAETLDWDTKRGRDFQCLALMIYFCQKEVEEPPAGKVEAWIADLSEPEAQFQRDIDETLANFYILVSTPKYQKAFTAIGKRLAPVEFVFIGTFIVTFRYTLLTYLGPISGVLLYIMKGKKKSAMANGAFNLRWSIRQSFEAIRLNNETITVMWRFVRSLAYEPEAPLLYKRD